MQPHSESARLQPLASQKMLCPRSSERGPSALPRPPHPPDLGFRVQPRPLQLVSTPLILPLAVLALALALAQTHTSASRGLFARLHEWLRVRGHSISLPQRHLASPWEHSAHAARRIPHAQRVQGRGPGLGYSHTIQTPLLLRRMSWRRLNLSTSPFPGRDLRHVYHQTWCCIDHGARPPPDADPPRSLIPRRLHSSHEHGFNDSSP